MKRKHKDGITYLLCKITKTAYVNHVNSNKDEIIIPRSIKHYFTKYTIKSLNRDSFSLKNIKLLKFSDDSDVEMIDEDAFNGSIIQDIEFPKSLKIISDSSFISCNLQQIDLSNTQIKIIGEKAFYHSNLANIKLPKSIKQIQNEAFLECKNLNSIEIPEDSDLKFIGFHAFAYSTLKKFTIPLKIKDFNPDWFFSTSQLTDLTFTPHLNRNFRWYDEGRSIIVSRSSDSDQFDMIVFAKRNIRQAMIGRDINHINDHAFYYCNKLTKIEFSKNSELKSIGLGSFSFSSIESISIPKSVFSIRSQAFYCCKCLKKVDIPSDSKINTLQYGVFQYAPIETIIIPSNVDKVNRTALAQCKNLKAIEYLGKKISFQFFAIDYFCYAQIFSCPNVSFHSISDQDLLTKFSYTTTLFFNSEK